MTRLANADGTITFVGTEYRAGRSWARTFLDVTIFAGSVQLSKDGKVIRLHPIRHDRTRELRAFANPQGRARGKNSAIGLVAQVPELDTIIQCHPAAAAGMDTSVQALPRVRFVDPVNSRGRLSPLG